MRKVIAIACADIHLQLNPPRCRAKEPNWLKAMQRPLDELRELARKHEAPIICAGDVLDRWNSPPELINWAMAHLPRVVAVPGQHDLPQHNYTSIYKSAYASLFLAQTIRDLMPLQRTCYAKMDVYGFPWGVPVQKIKNMRSEKINIALVHEYCWIQGHSYPNAPKEQRLTNKRKWLKQFDVVIFGDNHKGFQYTLREDKKTTTVFNCGTLMRRKTDEADYTPQVGLIMDNGSIHTHLLDTSKDVLERGVEEPKTSELDVTEFMEALDGLVRNPLDFRAAVQRYIDKKKPSKETQAKLYEAMEKTK